MHLTRRLAALRAMLADILAEAFAVEQRNGQPELGLPPELSTRDWADLPTFHPPTETEELRAPQRNKER